MIPRKDRLPIMEKRCKGKRGAVKPETTPKVESVTDIGKIAEEEYLATHCCNGMAWNIRDEHVSDETHAARSRYERAKEIQDQDGTRRYGAILQTSMANDRNRAILAYRAKK